MLSRNIQTVQNPPARCESTVIILTASAGFLEEINIKGDKKYADNMQKEIIAAHPLYYAYCGYGIVYNWL